MQNPVHARKRLQQEACLCRGEAERQPQCSALHHKRPRISLVRGWNLDQRMFSKMHEKWHRSFHCSFCYKALQRQMRARAGTQESLYCCTPLPLFGPAYLLDSSHTNVAQIQRINGFQLHALLKPAALWVDSTHLEWMMGKDSGQKTSMWLPSGRSLVNWTNCTWALGRLKFFSGRGLLSVLE